MLTFSIISPELFLLHNIGKKFEIFIYFRLPEPDRLKQLNEMEATHAALLADLYRLPVSADTRRVTEKRREIEGLLVGLDDGIRIYSRAKVFVKKTE